MLRRAKELNDYKLGARDGEVGEVKEFYFDDQSWTVRYLIADTGGWLSGRRVLIPPYGLDPADEGGKVIPVDLTRMQMEKSPSPANNRPVSRDRDGRSDASRRAEEEDPHLRSTQDVTGRNIQAQDGEIGHAGSCHRRRDVGHSLPDCRYATLVAGKKGSVSTRWIERISWE